MTAGHDAAGTLHELVARQAADRPDGTALVCGAHRLTYADLHTRAVAVATALRGRGVGPQDVVAVHTGRRPELVVALLGVLGAGAAVLPLADDLPPARRAALLADARVRLAVTSRTTGTTVTEVPTYDVDAPVPPADDYPVSVDADQAAYVIYTSGSTGVPKGVVVSHGPAVAHVRAIVGRLGLGPDDVVLQMAGQSFDVAMEQLFGGLAAGATVLLRDDRVWGPVELAQAVTDHGVTVADLPTALFAELTTARHAAACTAVAASTRTVLVGGEALSSSALARWHAAVGPDGPDVVNAYGPTETVMTASLHVARVEDGVGTAGVPIGSVVGPRALHVVDGELPTDAPTADEGELYVGGTALAQGYLGRPDLTADRFVPDPWGPPGARMYRTGDRVRRSGDVLTFLGRVDEQLKVRGFRIEPGEIESALLRHPAVAQACVTGGDGRLVAHVVGVEATTVPPTGELAAWLGERLPTWMVPTGWQVLDRLPLRPSGKVDRAALTAAVPVHRSAPDVDPTGGVDPRDGDADPVAAIWQRILDLPTVGADDRFLALGGTSLLAARVQADLLADLGVAVPLSDLLANPTLAELTDRVARAGTEPQPETGLPVLRPRTGDRGHGPLSVMQEQIWFFEQLSEANLAYNAPTTIRLTGPVDVRLLEAALTAVVRRHEILRTTVTSRDGEPVQIVHPPYPVRVVGRDLRAAPDPWAAAEHVVAAEIREPFDVGRLPLLRWTLLRLADEEYELILVEHHIIHDGWSFAMLVEEVLTNYAAVAGWSPAPADPTLQYLDFVHWQREALAGPGMRAQLEHWRTTLAGAPAHLDLPYDHPRGDGEQAAGAVHRVELPADLCAAVREFSRDRGVTLFVTMTAAYAAMLHRFTGQDELCVGSAYGNRAVPGTERILGMFVNPAVLRLATGGDLPFDDLLDQVRRVSQQAQAHQALPFVHLVRDLAPARRPGHNPLFAAMMNFDDAPLVPLHAGPISATYLERHNGTAKLDLSVLVVPRAERQVGVPAADRDQRITMIWEYRTDLFTAATVAGFAEAYRDLLRAVVDSPRSRLAELPLHAYAPTTAAPTCDVPTDDTVGELFGRVAATRSDTVAVVHPGHDPVTYADLDRRANRFAHLLRARGIGAEDVVGVWLPRGVDWVAAVLGALKAGATYLPLDPDSPPERIADLLASADPAALVTDRDLPGVRVVQRIRPDDPALAEAPDTDPAVEVHPDQLAYLIYTSGSTGRPKAVGISHRSLSAKYAAWRAAYDLDRHPGVHLQLAALAFDVCTGDLVRALLSGGRLVLCPPGAAADPAALLAVIRDHDVDTVELLPSVAGLLAAHLAATGDRLTGLRLAAIGGEAWTTAEYRRLRAAFGPDTRILNVYGVTEVTIGDTLRELGPVTVDDRPLPIGEPLPGVRVRILDAAGAPVPVGAVGEIVLGGVGVARGYHGRPDLTAQRFLPAPGGGRYYATGDRGRFRPDGGIEFLGRADSQVKIRGFRVEPGEVEHALRALPGVDDAVVVAHPDRTGLRLVAYVGGAGLAPTALRDALRGTLPSYLVPTAVTVLPTLPRTASGKVDRRALPAPDTVEPAPDTRSRPPEPGVEERVAAVWREVLGVAALGADDDFFDLGGHSLLAARVTARLLADLGVDLSVRDLLAAPTVAGVARRIGDGVPARPQPALVPRSRGAYRVKATALDPTPSAPDGPPPGAVTSGGPALGAVAVGDPTEGDR
ncbi:amino acid adenylation domain-containing protein [Micromonospora sp. SH-82]|uniref:amino acid adenylation domain-containing protein n=1 Tax=Micromonospora sp. SH-82 TaxID=3132938 RepID=UPI003EB790D3